MTVEGVTSPEAWLITLVLSDGVQVARAADFEGARALELTRVDEDAAEWTGALPVFDERERERDAAPLEEVWLRLAPRERGPPWREGWVAELSFVGAPAGELVELSFEQPVAGLRTRGRALIRLRAFSRHRVARAVPAGAGPPVPVHDVAFGRSTRQSSAASSHALAALFLWMPSTRPEARPWWELDTGAARFIDRVKLHLGRPKTGALRLRVFSSMTRAGEPAAPWSTTIEAFEGARTIEVGVVGRLVRVEAVAPPGEEVVLRVTAAEILAAELSAGSLLDTLRRTFTLFAERPLFSRRERVGDGRALGGYDRWLSYREVWARAGQLARGLAATLEREVEAGGDARVLVGICARGRAEWVITDLACVQRGYVVVPLARQGREELWAHIINDCGLQAIVCSPTLAPRFAALAERCPSLRLLVEMTPLHDEHASAPSLAAPGLQIHTIAQLERAGATRAARPAPARRGDELYTVLYTSGSTGRPKGSARSYDQFNAMVDGYGMTQPAIHLSYQPFSHLSERMTTPVVMRNGGQVGFASGDPARLFDDVSRLQPTVFGGVPRVFDLLRTRFHEALAEDPDARERELLRSLRALFGPRLQAVSVGSAKSSPALLEFMRRLFADCWMMEGYGLTEVGTIAVDGVIQPGVVVKLIDVPELGYRVDDHPSRGEVCVLTPYMSAGYLADGAARPRDVDEDGYFHTGDIGQLNEDGTLELLGRRGHIVKLAQGEFVAPEQIEAALSRCPLVDQLFVYASPLAAAVVAVVVPRVSTLRALMGGACPPAPKDLCESAAARARVLRALRDEARARRLPRHEWPAAVLLTAAPMTAESGLLTSSHKPDRRAIERRYGAALEALVAESSSVHVDKDIPKGNRELAAVVERVARAVLGAAAPALAQDLEGELALDSLAGADLVSALGEQLGREVPLSTWFAATSLEDLARRLSEGAGEDDARARAVADLERPLPFTSLPPRSTTASALGHVLLTGATGFLGRALLETLMLESSAEVTCLVRAPSVEEGTRRLRAYVSSGGAEWTDAWSRRVRVLPGDLAAPSLGLDEPRWRALASSVDTILHAAAVVSWIQRYGQLRAANVLGTLELVRLAASERLAELHLVSTISAAPNTGDEETTLSRERALASSGYALSKWIAERHVARAGARGLPVSIYRPGMIAGHSARGVGNPRDLLSRYLLGCAQLGRHLEHDAVLDMTPVDFVAQAIVALTRRGPASGRAYHLVNIERSLSYRQLGAALRRAGVDTRPASYSEFRAALLADGRARGPGANALLPLRAYFPAGGFALRMGPWPSDRTRAELDALGVRCPAIDDAMIARYLQALSDARPA